MKEVKLPPMKVLGFNGMARNGRAVIETRDGQMSLSVFRGHKTETYPVVMVTGTQEEMWTFLEAVLQAATER